VIVLACLAVEFRITRRDDGMAFTVLRAVEIQQAYPPENRNENSRLSVFAVDVRSLGTARLP
jgi:hypothetical protein